MWLHAEGDLYRFKNYRTLLSDTTPITAAFSFVMMQNQFFISSVKEVRNGIVEALRARIGKAYKEKETFRVIIVMPLLPSFNGEEAQWI